MQGCEDVGQRDDGMQGHRNVGVQGCGDAGSGRGNSSCYFLFIVLERL